MYARASHFLILGALAVAACDERGGRPAGEVRADDGGGDDGPTGLGGMWDDDGAGEPPCPEGARSADGDCHPSQGEGEPDPAGEGEGEPVPEGEGEGEPVPGGEGEGEPDPVGEGEGEPPDPDPDPDRLQVIALNGAQVNVALQVGGWRIEGVSDDQVRAGVLAERRYVAAFVGNHYRGTDEAWLRGIEQFVLEGGGLVTEFDGAVHFFSGMADGMRFPDLPQNGWFAGTVGSGQGMGADSPIDHALPAHPLVVGLPDPIRGGQGTQFFFTLHDLQPGLQVVATFTGNGFPGFPRDEVFPAIISTQVCGTPVVFMPFDYGDEQQDPELSMLIQRAATQVTRRLDGPLVGVCPR